VSLFEPEGAERPRQWHTCTMGQRQGELL